MADTTLITGLPESDVTRKLREAREQQTQKQEEPLQTQPQVVEKIVEREVYPADVKSVIEKARQEEKQKLYDKISRAESIESENTALKKSITQIESENADLKAKFEASAKEPKKRQKENEEVNISMIVDETAKAVAQELGTRFQKEREELTTRIRQLEQSLTQRDISVLREKLIAEAGGKIIPALVRGSTEEEIQTSVIEAKKEYERIASSFSSALTTPASSAASAPSSHVPAANGTTQPAASTIVAPGSMYSGAIGESVHDDNQRFGKSVRDMGRDEYAAARKSILKQVKQRFSSDKNAFTDR